MKTNRYNYLIVSCPPRTCFKTSFMKKSKIKKKNKFVKKFRTNRGISTKILIWDLFEFSWDVVILPHIQPKYPSLRGTSPQGSLVLTDGWVMGDWWWVMGGDGQPKSKKITYFSNFSKTIRYFFLVVSRPLRIVFKTFSEKNSKKIKNFNFVKKFRTSQFLAIFRQFSF